MATGKRQPGPRPTGMRLRPGPDVLGKVPKIPDGPPGDIAQAAQQVTEKLLAGDLAPRTVVLGQTATANNYDVKKRSVMGALIQDCTITNSAAMKALVQGMGWDLNATNQGLARQESAWQGYLLAEGITKAARGGRQLVGGARVLGRSLVKAAVAAQRQGLKPDDQEALDDDFLPVVQLEETELQQVQDQRQKTQTLQEQTTQQLSDQQLRQRLQQVLAGLASGETFDYATLVAAADTLESLLGKEPGAAKVAEDDRRGSGR